MARQVENKGWKRVCCKKVGFSYKKLCKKFICLFIVKVGGSWYHII
jgi:hypothetical protein